MNIKYIFLFLLALPIFALGQVNFIDNFNATSYSNNNGNANFATNWVENGETTSPTAGRILINSSQLRFRNLDAVSISRSLDLSGATSATLTFNFNRTSGPETLLMQLFDGTTYNTRATLAGTGSVSYNLTAAELSASSAIRFISGSGGWKNNDTIFVDDVQFTVTIPPAISIDDISVDEDAGSATFTVEHINADTSGPFTVNYQTINGTASGGGVDFTDATGLLSFNGTIGDTETITVLINDDSIVEPSEYFQIIFTHSPDDPTVILTDVGTGTITDNDSIIITNGTTENTCSGQFFDSGGNFAAYGPNEDIVYTICPDSPGNDINLNFTFFDVESVSDNLYIYEGTSTTGTLIGQYHNSNLPPSSIKSTDTSGCLTFRFISNNAVNQNGWAATISCTLSPPKLVVEDVTVDEDAGTTSFTVVHEGLPASGPFSVTYNTVDGTAVDGSDYTGITSGVLNFDGTVGDSELIVVNILDDADSESSETFTVQFATSSDPAVNITDVALATIVDNDFDPDSPRPYEERYSMNLQGNFLMKGNTNLECVSSCPGTPTSNNPSAVMGYVDVDGDGSTVNSSSSTITIPTGATVTYAGLYWGGVYNSTRSGITNPSGTLDIDQVKLRTPASTTYTTISAEVRNIETASFTEWNSFMAHADITSHVQASGSGTYFVADIALATGSAFTGPNGGWTMVIIYDDPTEKSRNIAVWDGFDFFGFGDNDSFTVTGLLTPTSGTFETHAGYFAFDGEGGAAYSGDFVSINGTALSNALNPSDNTLNGTISEFGVDIGGRNPNFGYSWGIDIDFFDATGLVPNSAADMDVVLGSANEGIWGGVFVTSNEIAFPAVSSKIFTPMVIYEGQESSVTINIENPATGVDLTNLSFIDNLPAGMVISPVPNASSSCGGTLVANPGGNAFSISGLSLSAGSTCTFTFNVLMNIAGDYVNTITALDISNDQNIPLSGNTSSSITVLPFVDTDNDGIGDHADLDDDNDGITDCEESLDSVSDEFAWSLNTPTGNLDMDYVLDSKITDWAISSAETMVLNSPIFSSVGANLHIVSMTSTNVEEAINNGDFVEVEFTTGSELSSFEINNMRSGWYLPSEGDSYYSSTFYSVNGSDAWETLASDTFHTDDGSSYATFDHMNVSSLPVLPNTAYRFRIYVYGQIDDSAQNYSILDDINFAITACRFVDTDGDSVPDHLDTDSDEDGCGDADEAYGNQDTDLDNNGMYGSGTPLVNPDGTVTGASYQTPADGDANGNFDFQEGGSPPAISNEPLELTMCVGCSGTFSVSASNIDSYQWQLFNGSTWDDLANSGIHSGTTSSILSITNATSNDSGNQYRVVLTNSSYSCAYLISNQAVLTVNVATVITNRRITYRVNKN